jgi:hypothetical protein
MGLQKVAGLNSCARVLPGIANPAIQQQARRIPIETEVFVYVIMA